MTNGEINLDIAIKALEAGKLNSFESSFVESIKDYDKYDLKNLSRKQYDVLQSIYKKFHYQF
jgi:hypothetical protein